MVANRRALRLFSILHGVPYTGISPFSYRAAFFFFSEGDTLWRKRKIGVQKSSKRISQLTHNHARYPIHESLLFKTRTYDGVINSEYISCFLLKKTFQKRDVDLKWL